MQPHPEAHCESCESLIGNIFCGLPPKQIQYLDQNKVVRNYRKKQNLFFEGNPANGVFCIKSGLIKLYKTGPEGRQYILDLLGPRDVMGMEAVFSDQPYSATAEMIEEGIVCFIKKEAFLEIMRKDCNLALKVAQYLANQLVDSEEERLELAQAAVRERFARLLSLLARSHGRRTPKGIVIDLKLNREEMAEMIGTAAETAMRLLKEFKEEKLVAVKGKEIIVLDQEGLARTSHMV